jgi:uncharacterized iron-regulated membrane protein
MNKKLQLISQGMQVVRKIHRWAGLNFAFFVLVVTFTGILLGYKSNSNELMMPNTYKGTAQNISEWISLDSITTLAQIYIKNIDPEASAAIDRIDIRPSKGVAKVRFEEHIWMAQIDGKTGELLHMGKRYADVIESIHDGSIIDKWLGTNGIFKLIFISLIGLSLLIFLFTGLLLYIGPMYISLIMEK